MLRILPGYVNCGTLLIVSPALEKDEVEQLCWLASWINISVFFVFINRPAVVAVVVSRL